MIFDLEKEKYDACLQCHPIEWAKSHIKDVYQPSIRPTNLSLSNLKCPTTLEHNNHSFNQEQNQLLEEI